MRFPTLRHPLAAMSIGVLVLASVVYMHVRYVVPFRASVATPTDIFMTAPGLPGGASSDPFEGTFGTCRNGVVESIEECDDGNEEENDACSNSCTRQRQKYCIQADGAGGCFCTENWLTEFEEADRDWCYDSMEMCDSRCAGTCGDGDVNFGEQCDEGTRNGRDDSPCTANSAIGSGDGCRRRCPAFYDAASVSYPAVHTCTAAGRLWSWLNCRCEACSEGSVFVPAAGPGTVPSCQPNFACPAANPANPSAVSAKCNQKCNEIFDGHESIQLCVAYCVCQCAGDGNAAYTATNDCIVDKPPACPSGEPACCRAEAISNTCPPGGGGAPPPPPPPPPHCFPAPVCPPGNACVTYRVNFACACEAVRVLPDFFCGGTDDIPDDNGDGDNDDNIPGNDDNGDEVNDDGIEDNGDDDGDGDDDDGIPGNDDGGDDGGDEAGDDGGDIGDIFPRSSSRSSTASLSSDASSGGNDDDDGDGDNDDGDGGNEDDDGDGDDDDGIPGDEDDGDGDNDDGIPGNDDDDGDGDNDDGIPDNDDGDGGTSSLSSAFSLGLGFSSGGFSGRSQGVSLASGASRASGVSTNRSQSFASGLSLVTSVRSGASVPRSVASGASQISGTSQIALAICGDGFINQSSEQCDDGNARSGDGCSATCSRENNRDTDNDDNGDRDNDDGIPGNNDRGGGDGSSGGQGRESDIFANLTTQQRLIAAASLCGNGILESFEECDDRNRRDDDGCSSSCFLEIGICGDGIVQKLLGEQCEQATHDPSLPYLCRNCLTASLSCGDGKLDPGEECDDGPLNSVTSDAACRPDCHAFRCGDGILDSNEICDDGNRLRGDGCDRYCRVEEGEPGVTVIAGEQMQNVMNSQFPIPNFQQFPFPGQQFPFPYQLPFAQLQPLMTQAPATAQTGPAAIAVIGAGAAAGFSFIRNHRKRR